MPTTKKILTVQNLAEKFKQAKGLILTDYSGLNVEQINKLRGEIEKAGGEFEVVKNTLLCLAAKSTQYAISKESREASIRNTQLEGPSAALWLYKEDFSPLKALDNFIKQTELPKIKFGFWEGELIDLERIKELASLPTLPALQAKLVATLQSPTSCFVWMLNANIAKLIFILKSACQLAGMRGGETI